MKQFLFCIGLVLLCFQAKAHEFYFAFAEAEYNPATKRMEVSIEATAHDVEYYLRKKGVEIPKKIEDETRNKTFLSHLESVLNEGFSLIAGEQKLKLTLIGYEVMPNGVMYAYLESDECEPTQELEIHFPFLMDVFPDQQNKITFTYLKNKQTAVFLPTKQSETILFDSNEN